MMDATALLKDFCSAVERRDGKAFASLFTEDGVYHDVSMATSRAARRSPR